MSIVDDKRRVRREVRALMRAAAADDRLAAGERVTEHVRPLLDELASPVDVALFASIAAEIASAPLDAELEERGLGRALPRVAHDELVFHRVPRGALAGELVPSTFGVPEPPPPWPVVELSSCALLFVPGVAFDRAGRRLGYGKAFYDRALARARLAARPPLAVGLAMDCQLIGEVPAAEHDEPVDALCTPSLGLVRLRAAGAR